MKLDNILARYYGITLPPKPVEEARDLVKAHNGKLNQFKWFSQEGLWSVLVSSKDAKYITDRLLNARIYTGWKFSKTLTPEGAEIIHIYTEERALKDQIDMWLTDSRPPVMVMRQEEVLAKPASLFKLKSWVKKIPNNSWNFTDYAMSRVITGKAASFLVKRLNFTKNSMGNFEWKHCVVLMEPTPLTAENPNKATTNLIIQLDNFRDYMPMADAAMLQDVVKELEKLIGEAGAVMVMRQEEATPTMRTWMRSATWADMNLNQEDAMKVAHGMKMEIFSSGTQCRLESSDHKKVTEGVLTQRRPEVLWKFTSNDRPAQDAIDKILRGHAKVMRQEEAIGLKLKWQQTKKPLSYELKDIDIEFGDKLLKSETGWKSSNNNPDSVYNDKYFIRLFRTESFYTMSTKTRVPSCRMQTLTLANAKTIDTEYSEYLKLKSHVMVMRQEEAAEVGYMGWTVTFEGIGMYNARTWIHDPAIVDLLKAKLFLKKRDVAGLESFEDPRGDLSIYVPKVFNKGTGYDAIVKTKDRQKEVDKVVKAAGLVNRAWVKPPVMVMRQEEGLIGEKAKKLIQNRIKNMPDWSVSNYWVSLDNIGEPALKRIVKALGMKPSPDKEGNWEVNEPTVIHYLKSKNRLIVDFTEIDQQGMLRLISRIEAAVQKPPGMVMRQEEASGDKKVLKWTKFDGSYEAEVPAEFGKWYADKYNFVNTVRGSNGRYKLIQGNFLSLVTIKQPENNSWPWVFIVVDNRVKIAISTAWASDVWKPKHVMVMRQEESKDEWPAKWKSDPKLPGRHYLFVSPEAGSKIIAFYRMEKGIQGCIYNDLDWSMMAKTVPGGYMVYIEHSGIFYKPASGLSRAVDRITAISKEFPPPVMVMRQEEVAFSRTRFLPGLRKVTESKKPAPTIKFK